MNMLIKMLERKNEEIIMLREAMQKNKKENENEKEGNNNRQKQDEEKNNHMIKYMLWIEFLFYYYWKYL